MCFPSSVGGCLLSVESCQKLGYDRLSWVPEMGAIKRFLDTLNTVIDLSYVPDFGTLDIET